MAIEVKGGADSVLIWGTGESFGAVVSHLLRQLVTGHFLGSGSWQGVGWPMGAGACSVCLFDTLEPLSASPCGPPRVLPVPLAACSKVCLIYTWTWGRPGFCLLDSGCQLAKAPAETSWGCFMGAAFAELAGRSHLRWLWAQHSL